MIHHSSDPNRLPAPPAVSRCDRGEALAQLITQYYPAQPVEQLDHRYPKRSLGEVITRIAPSPTGLMHIGGMYIGLINYLVAKKSKGTFVLRIEDTDQQRLVAGAREGIVSALTHFGISSDEGPKLIDGRYAERGDYGPYVQSQRVSLYWACALELVKRGKAYPCFASVEELESCRVRQQQVNAPPGYYGQWALWRDADLSRVEQELSRGTPFVIRSRTENEGGQVKRWADLIKGNIEAAVNTNDLILIKADRYPTYHFANVIDDHFMGISHVIRGEEFVVATPIHLDLFSEFGWNPPRYGHCPLIHKIEIRKEIDADSGQPKEIVSRRKISKRHDVEASVDHYFHEGYCTHAVIDYLLNLANSGFEPWRAVHPTDPWTQFPLCLEDFGTGALLDPKKLDSINREWLAKMPIDELLVAALKWSREYAPLMAKDLDDDHDYSRRVLEVERYAKRITTLKELEERFGPFFERVFNARSIPNLPSQVTSEVALKFLQVLTPSPFISLTRDEWFNQVRALGASLGYAPDKKQYKASPQIFAGQAGDLFMVLRHALWRSEQSPDLFAIMEVLGPDRVASRIRVYCNSIPGRGN